MSEGREKRSGEEKGKKGETRKKKERIKRIFYYMSHIVERSLANKYGGIIQDSITPQTHRYTTS